MTTFIAVHDWWEYCVSEDGEVFSDRDRSRLANDPPKKIKCFDGGNGYLYVNLTKTVNGKMKRKKAAVHRLVAQAFIANRDRKPVVNHKDGNRGNNKVGNLEWATQYENVHHAIDVLGFNPRGPKKPKMTRKNGALVLSVGANNPLAKDVYQFGKDLTLLAKYGCLQEAADAVGSSKQLISKSCVSGGTSGGYYWRNSSEFENHPKKGKK